MNLYLSAKEDLMTNLNKRFDKVCNIWFLHATLNDVLYFSGVKYDTWEGLHPVNYIGGSIVTEDIARTRLHELIRTALDDNRDYNDVLSTMFVNSSDELYTSTTILLRKYRDCINGTVTGTESDSDSN